MKRFGLHLLFWAAYWFIYAYTYSRYDGHLAKYLISEGMQMLPRMLATYLSFWCMDRLSGRYGLVFGGIALSNLIGALLNRVVKMLWVVPWYFADSTFSFWHHNFMYDLFDCVVASGTALTARLYFRQQESIRREQQLKSEKSEAELRALKNQLNPHFLFNTINNLYALARIRSEKTAPVALKLAHLLRYVLYESEKKHVAIEQEIQLIKDYVALEQLRFDTDRLQVDFHTAIDDNRQLIAPLLLLPLVENAFKHGVGEQRESAWVKIDINLKNRQLSALISNSMTEENKQTDASGANGIGLRNLQRQLELQYPGAGLLRLDAQKNEFSARLDISLPNN